MNYILYNNIVEFINFRNKKVISPLDSTKVQNMISNDTYIMLKDNNILIMLFDYTKDCPATQFKKTIKNDLVDNPKILNDVDELIVTISLKNKITGHIKYISYIKEIITNKQLNIYVVNHDFFACNLPKRLDFTPMRLIDTQELENLKLFYNKPNFIIEIPRIPVTDVCVRWHGFKKGQVIEISTKSLTTTNNIEYRYIY